jgi:ATP-dependent 26S proteasome regulatory subunit
MTNEERKEKDRLRYKAYYAKNKEIINNKKKEKYKNDPSFKEKELNRYKNYRNNNLEKSRERERIYKKINNEKVQVYKKTKYNTDINYKLAQVLRTRMRKAVKNNSNSSIDLIGISIDGLILYLESKMKDDMTWENYGKWQIDHIIPCSFFDLTDPKQKQQCFHYTNLQPLWAKENRSKGNKIITEDSKDSENPPPQGE